MSTKVHLQRRRALAGALACCSLPLWTGTARASIESANVPRLDRRVIVYSMLGGNDGLNTVVPLRDPLYRRLRPTLGLPGNTTLPLNGDLGLHPALRNVHRLYADGDAALVLDVGYPNPNLSHFESRAVWDSGQPGLGLRATEGWYGGVVRANRATFDRADLDVAAVVMQAGDMFADGEGVSTLNTSNIRNFLSVASEAEQLSITGAESQRAMVSMLNNTERARSRLRVRLQDVPMPNFGNDYMEPLMVHQRMVSWFIDKGVRTAAFKIAQSGFDTHTDQLVQQQAQLQRFDKTLGDMVNDLKTLGVWSQTVIVAYSEFGRRAAENGGGGTDHGSAGPVFLFGGGVRSGVHGQRADLERLDSNGNLVATTDLREIYRSLVGDFFHLPVNPFGTTSEPPLQLFRGA